MEHDPERIGHESASSLYAPPRHREGPRESVAQRLVGKGHPILNKTDVTTDEIPGMIIMGKLPGEVTQRELAELHG